MDVWTRICVGACARRCSPGSVFLDEDQDLCSLGTPTQETLAEGAQLIDECVESFRDVKVRLLSSAALACPDSSVGDGRPCDMVSSVA